MAEKPHTRLLGQGRYWQELKVGQVFHTFRRTVTEADLVGFIGVTGMLEVIFIDTTYDGAMTGRAVPAALTYSLIEGMLMQTLLQGVGLALLEVSMKAHAPTRVGDTIWASVEMTEIKPTSKGNRAVASSEVKIFNQKDELVLSYTVKRMCKGDPAAAQ